MFDSPFEFCEVCKQYVLLDQCKRECAQEHECEPGKCPLERYFVGIDYAILAEEEREHRVDVTGGKSKRYQRANGHRRPFPQTAVLHDLTI
jgi:hypothetical protein